MEYPVTTPTIPSIGVLDRRLAVRAVEVVD
jgi:hypothetical protein